MKTKLVEVANQIGIIYGHIGEGYTAKETYITIFRILYNTYETIHKNIKS